MFHQCLKYVFKALWFRKTNQISALFNLNVDVILFLTIENQTFKIYFLFTFRRTYSELDFAWLILLENKDFWLKGRLYFHL